MTTNHPDPTPASPAAVSAPLRPVEEIERDLADIRRTRELATTSHLWRRCAKAGEEHGEVIEALLGLVGENPRKGVTADREKVIKELLDEAFAALGAVEHLRGNDGSSGRLLAEHAVFVTTRLRAALAEGASR